ncbi:hypothetical protein V1478_014652, partial [Vespula squamosa]
SICGDHERSKVTVAEGEAIRTSTIIKRVPLTNDIGRIGEVPRQVVAAIRSGRRRRRRRRSRCTPELVLSSSFGVYDASGGRSHDHFLWLNAYNNLVTTRIEDSYGPRGFDKDTMQGVLSGPVVDQYRSRANRLLGISVRSNPASRTSLTCLKMFWLVR